VRRAPGLFTASRDGETGGKLIDRLEGEADFDAPGELRGDSLAEVLLEVGPDDEDDFPEAGADGIEDPFVAGLGLVPFTASTAPSAPPR
jgi:hypothetical protein